MRVVFFLSRFQKKVDALPVWLRQNYVFGRSTSTKNCMESFFSCFYSFSGSCPKTVSTDNYAFQRVKRSEFVNLPDRH